MTNSRDFGKLVRIKLGDIGEGTKEAKTARPVQSAAEFREIFGDGVFGGPYQASAQIMDEIFAAASANARERVRLAFVVQRIAENAKIQVEQEDIVRQVRMVAAMNSIPEAEILKDLNRNQNGLNDMIRQALHEKTLRFLEQNAVVTETPPAA